MKPVVGVIVLAIISLSFYVLPVHADWGFNGKPSPTAFVQSNNMSLELQCDRIRFAPTGYEDAKDIESQQALSIRFLNNGSREVGAFQAGSANSSIKIVDNFPIEITFAEKSDYNFILDQIAQNAVLNLSMVEKDVSYGIFDLKGSGAAIKSLRAACVSKRVETKTSMEAPEGVVYCGGGQIKRQIEYVISEKSQDQWDARVTVNGNQIKAMTSYSYFGNSQPPKGFVVALLGEDRSEFLVFRDGNKDWLEFGDYTYRKCN